MYRGVLVYDIKDDLSNPNIVHKIDVNDTVMDIDVYKQDD